MTINELVEIVGAANVSDEPAALVEFLVDSSVTPPIKPSCVIRPENTDQVQSIVQWANKTHTALVPVSSGGPHFHGDTAPGKPGAVIIDLSRMKKIIRIDARNKLALIEPGVTYDQLQAELEKVGLCAYMPLLPRMNKSVVSSVLEREPIIVPAHHWDSTDPLLCAEVVFGTGDKFRTGEASGPDTIEEQWEMGRVQMNPFGHSHVDFQRLLSGAQGTIGIITWASIKCCYLSKMNSALFVPSDKLEPLIDLMYKPLKFRLGGKLFILNGQNLACLLGKNAREIQEITDKLPLWVLFISFEGYGILPGEKIAYEEADFTAMARAVNLTPVEKIGGIQAKDMNLFLSRPSTSPYWKTRLKGGVQDIFFLTTLDKTAEFTGAVTDLTKQQKYPKENIGVYIQPIVQGTSCHCEFEFFHNPNNKAELEATKKMINTAAEKIAAMGGFFSRPYSAWKEIAYRNANGTMNMQKKIKAIFDPNAILNPGKLGF